jgi:hypothetical protein
MTLTLNSTVRIVSKSGSQQRSTIREVIKLGSGKAYEGLIMLDEWPGLLQAYQAELADPLATINERIRLACKECHKAIWWAEVGFHQYARAVNREATAAEAMEAGAEFKEAEEKLTKLLQEEYDLFQQGYQAPAHVPAPELAPVTEQQSGVYLNTRSRSIWV